MDIIKFAEHVKRYGFVERHDAEVLRDLAEIHLRIQDLADEVNDSATPVYTASDKAKLAELHLQATALELVLNDHPTRIRIGDKQAAHLYNVEVRPANGPAEIIEVDADFRDQARSVAEAAGYTVASVNLVG